MICSDKLSYNLYSSIKAVGATVLCGLWVLECAWDPCAAQEAQESACQIATA